MALTNQLTLFEPPPLPAPIIDLDRYDRFLVMFSGGKDSLGCLLHLLDLGVDRTRIELWHHDVDGRSSTLMDWPVTRSYVAAVGRAFNIPVYYSWRDGGIEREMLRRDQPTASVSFETPLGRKTVGGTSHKRGTRLKHPAPSPDLRVRWCSAVAKIDVADAAIRNDPRFIGTRTLVLTGERAEESKARSQYAPFEPHRTDTRNTPRPRQRRHVDHWRPVLHWSAIRIWEIIERHRVNPHPGYHAGFGRISCLVCIFASPNQLATIQHHAPRYIERHRALEISFDHTVHNGETITARAARGRSYQAATPTRMTAGLSHEFNQPIILATGEWRLPAGAYAEQAGPT